VLLDIGKVICLDSDKSREVLLWFELSADFVNKQFSEADLPKIAVMLDKLFGLWSSDLSGGMVC
jgi:hypothetical protein